MDYLDPRKRQRQTVMLYIGYVLSGIAVLAMTVVLLYQANGFGIDRKGDVIQNGLVFVSSQPQRASIYIDGQLKKEKTNSRLVIPAGSYSVSLQRQGYQSWTRTLDIAGGKVQRFDYPLLVPSKLATTNLKSYPAAPSFATQSPDRRWLIVAPSAATGSFEVFNLRKPAQTPELINLPADLLTASTAAQSWQVIEWADNNRHVLLQRLYGDNSEYVLLDRQNPLQSLNLTRRLAINPTKLQLIDRKFDRYYAFDALAQSLGRISLESTVMTPVLTQVLDYSSYSDDMLLYTTSLGASSGQVRVRLLAGNTTYTIRSLPAGTSYLLDITKYDDIFYAVVGATSENKAYVYRDPAGQIGTNVFKSPVPLHILRTAQPTYVSFSSNTQFVMIQNGKGFAVYDIEYDNGYVYNARQPLDAPQTNATWMDGNRLSYVSDGKHVIFDYDYQNSRILSDATAAYKPFFAPDYRYSYTLAPGAESSVNLTQTGLRTPSEL